MAFQTGNGKLSLNGISGDDSGYQTPSNNGDGNSNIIRSQNGLSGGEGPVIDITKDLNALVRQQMLATPNAIALEDETTTLTYLELDKRCVYIILI